MRRLIPLVLSLSASSFLRAGVLDTFEDLAGWRAVTSHGDASKASLRLDAGRTGNALLMEYSFLGHMGSAAAEKRFDAPLPANYQLSFDIRGEGLPNNFVIRLMDSVGNVWWVNRSNCVFPAAWTRMTIRKSQFQYGWGPSGGGDLRRLDRIMLMIDVVEGGKGKVWIDNLAVEPLAEGMNAPLRVSVSSFLPGVEAPCGFRPARCERMADRLRPQSGLDRAELRLPEGHGGHCRRLGRRACRRGV